MASSDDSVREINLGGKQLVFLFMAAAVISVGIFLCGVLVGRGVQSRASVAAAAPVPADAEEVDPAIDLPARATPAEPTKATGLQYPERLEGAAPVAEKLVPRGAEPTPSAAAGAVGLTSAANDPGPASTGREPAAPGAASATAPIAPVAAASPANPTSSAPPPGDATPLPPEPKGDGFAIQVTALRGRGEAEAVVGRLKQKGYSAYLLPPLAGQPSVYRVRVGKFKGRSEAEQVAARLEREEQFNPWITR